MKKSTKAYVVFYISLFACSSLLAFETSSLNSTITRDDDPGLFKQIYSIFGESASYLVQSGTSGLYYSVTSGGEYVGRYNLDSETVEGWPLTRWPHTYVPEALVENFSFDSKQSKQSIRERLAAPPDGFDGAGEPVTNVGCLPETPLRYGNIFNASEKDLLIVLGGQLIVFSPTYERTVFAEYYHHDDVYPGSIEDYRWETPVAHYGSLHTMQYAQVAIPAVRSYTKLYVDNVDGDDHPDVVVWRKVYRSNLETEPEGYSLISNTFAHYEQNLDAQADSDSGVTGEYLPQNIDEGEIQQWLADNDLTWQAGYPNQSECSGQTDQHIPEMVDPLLNDPEVLE